MQEQLERDVEQELTVFVNGIPLDIDTPEQFQEAELNFIAVRKKRKEVEQWFEEKIIRPARKALDALRAEAKTKAIPLVTLEAGLEAKMQEWRRAEKARRDELQRKELKLQEQREARAVKKGKDPEEVRPAKYVAPLAKSNQTAAGMTTYVTRTVVVIFDESLIPLDKPEYWEITRKPVVRAIRAALQSGKTVPGCHLEERQEMRVRG